MPGKVDTGFPSGIANNKYAGLDGCRAGWVMVTWSGKSDEAPQAVLISGFAPALETAATTIAVDMPIGLPSLSGRTCERETRTRLGQRQSSVFAVPSRAAVMEQDYFASCRVNLENSDPPRKVSKQCFMLFPKIREIDAEIIPELQCRVWEVHPELAFWAMNGCQSVPLAKKIKSRPNPEGMALRRELLTRNGFPVDRLQHPSWPKSKVAEDDILDACACAWSAARIARGEHISLPAEPEFDARGLRMQISA
jgi:predicted RNase H-like nuclease